eukprot:15343823-Ditylum_brightwellii.AAC.1
MGMPLMAYQIAVAISIIKAAMSMYCGASKPSDLVAVRRAELMTSLMVCDKLDVKSNGVCVNVREVLAMILVISQKDLCWRMQLVKSCIVV